MTIILARFVESKCLMRLDFKSTTLSQSSKEEKQCLLIYVFFVANAMREKDQNSTNVPLQYMMIFASIFIDNTLKMAQIAKSVFAISISI